MIKLEVCMNVCVCVCVRACVRACVCVFYAGLEIMSDKLPVKLSH